jgi:WXG100 family type VII secretion target
MAGTIKITPTELREGSTFLGQKLEAMTTEANQLKNRIDTIASNWEGAAQSSFVSGFTEKMWPVLSKDLPDLITGIQQQLTETARVLEETDSEIAGRLRG